MNEVVLTTLDVLELILDNFDQQISENKGETALTHRVFGMFNLLLNTGVSESVMPHVFSALFACVDRYCDLIWSRSSNYCQELCLQVRLIMI